MCGKMRSGQMNLGYGKVRFLYCVVCQSFHHTDEPYDYKIPKRIGPRRKKNHIDGTTF